MPSIDLNLWHEMLKWVKPIQRLCVDLSETITF